jgi:hypothetical protein
VDQSTAVCVIGPGRAGTSMTMRVLNLLGVDIGPEVGLVEPGPGGPKGFWEQREIIKLNDRLLRRQGGSWRKPPQLTPGWEESPELEPEREQARALLEASFGGRQLWGWKDPRVSLTTAFWQRLVPGLRFVICLRNPIDTADSISPAPGRKQDDAFYYSRRGPKLERAYGLWGTYVASALANTAGQPRLLVSYDDHFDRRQATVERLARFVGRKPPAPGSEADRCMEEFVDPELRHYRTPPSQVPGDGRLPENVVSLYLMSELLRLVAPLPGKPGGAGFDALQESVDNHARRLLAAGAGELGRPAPAPAVVSR